MRTFAALFIGLTCLLTFVHSSTIDKSVDIPSKVDIYFLNDDYRTKISVPSKYPESYQIPTGQLSVNATFRERYGSRSANVTKTGLIKPKGTAWYWKNGIGRTSYVPDADKVVVKYEAGVSVIYITDGDYTHEITVNVIDYSDIYIEEKMKRVISEIITPGMTDLQKFTNITKWVAHNTDYSPSYWEHKPMLILECGDCWASTETIVELSKRAGIYAWPRRANFNAFTNVGHKNAITFIHNTYYIGEAGIDGHRPRAYAVYEEPSGFGISDHTFYQYDGNASTLTIPSEFEGKSITGLGKGVPICVNKGVETVIIPASILNISVRAFFKTETLKTIKVDSKNPNYVSVDNVLYTKDRKMLMFTPWNKNSLKIDRHTEMIEYGAISYCNLTKLVIPGHVKTLDGAVLLKSRIDELKIEKGVEAIGDNAFEELVTPQLVIPDSVKSLGNNTFESCNATVLVLGKGITEIPKDAFKYCRSRKVVLNSDLTALPDGTFSSCYYLENITIPDSVKSIGTNMFTSSIENIFFRGSEEEWGKISANLTLPSKTNITFDFKGDYDFDDDGFPAWAAIILAIVGIGVISCVVALAIVLVKKNRSPSSNSNSVELGASKSSPQPSNTNTKPTHAAPSRPPPTTAPPVNRPPPLPPRH